MSKGERRIYVVSKRSGTDPQERLVRATVKGQALRHVAEAVFDVRVAKQSDLERLLPTVKVEEAVETNPTQEKLPV